MKILCNRGALTTFFFVVALTALLFVQTTSAQSKLNVGNPASSNTTSTPMEREKEAVKRELMTMFFAKWDSVTWGKIRKMLEESPWLLNERISLVSLLHRASAEGNLEAAEWLLSHGMDVDIKSDGWATPLFHVQDVQMARLLLEHGADVDMVNDAFGQSPLYGILANPLWFHPERGAAQRVESEKIASMLMACGAEIDQEDSNGNDFLHVLAMGEHYQWLEYYLRKGANPNTKDRAGLGIWFVPIMKKQNDIVDWLENRGLKYDPQDEALVTTVLKSGNKHVMKKFQKKGFDINREDSKTGFTLLERAIISGNTNSFDMLLECGAHGFNANKSHNGKLLIRSALKNIEFARYLMAQGYDANAKDASGRTPLFSAILVGPKEVVEFLLNNGADKNQVCAVDSDAFGWVDMANHKIVRLKSVTPLLLAVCGWRKNMVEVLLAYGADVNLRMPEGYTALAVAEKLRKKDIANLLRRNGAVE